MAMTISRPLQEKHIRNGRRVTVRRRTRPPYSASPAPAKRDDVTDWDFTEAELMAIDTVTPEESAQMFDDDARRDLGISGREFLQRWESGVYDDASDRDQHGRAVLRQAFFLSTIDPNDLPD